MEAEYCLLTELGNWILFILKGPVAISLQYYYIRCNARIYVS